MSQALLEKVESAANRGLLTADSPANLKRWLTEPAFTSYLPRLEKMIEAGQWDDLNAAFWTVIPFGTGGRRGIMGALGTATINERTIAESAHGLAAYLKKHTGQSGGTAVIAYDTRIRSTEFARLSATTLAAHGLKVYLFDSHRSTPELSFAVRHLKCDVGIMISASHNPPSDNGFKAYWSSGGQVLPPHDKGIIDCVYEAGEIPQIDFDQAVAEGQIEIVGLAIDEAFLAAVAEMSLSSNRDVKALFSPLHGVGETSVYHLVQKAGFNQVEIYGPQREADGHFPNVPDQLPNPERPEVFVLLAGRAQEMDAALILASDPDADRLGVSVRNTDGAYVHLTGNQIGTLIADYVLHKRSAAGTLSSEHYVVETLVTTPLMGAIARSHQVRVIDDLLVGFKYIGQTMDAEGPEQFVFGAEESLGYLAGNYARDKDATIASLYILEYAGELQQAGKTLLDRLDELYQEHGYFLEGQHSEYCHGPQGHAQIEQLIKTFREDPPAGFAGLNWSRVRDYGRHEIRSLPDNQQREPLTNPSGNLMFFEADQHGLKLQLAVRPSGTEPKIKFYFFIQIKSDGSVGQMKTEAQQLFDRSSGELKRWVKQVISD